MKNQTGNGSRNVEIVKKDAEKGKKESLKKYDVVIVGGGVAGMTAAIYAKRRGKNVCIIEKFSLGGQVTSIPKIENFPSCSEIDGFSLAQKFSEQIRHLGVEILFDDIQKVDYSGKEKLLFGRKNTYQSGSVIIATGLSYVELGLDENRFLGRGVSFCAVCDGHFFKGKTVCVASKNGSGLKDALVLAEVCAKVILLDSGDLSIYAKANKNPKIEVISGAKITRLLGDEILTGVEIEWKKNCAIAKENVKKEREFCDDKGIFCKEIERKTGEKTGQNEIEICAEKSEMLKIEASALFVSLGKKPDGGVFGGVKVDENGFVITDEAMRTSVAGVFAAGDVRSKDLKQIVTACADGAIAGQNA